MPIVHTTKLQAAIVARQAASGPFSYVTKNGRKVTILKWGMDESGEPYTIERDAMEYREHSDHIDRVIECEAEIDYIKNLIYNLTNEEIDKTTKVLRMLKSTYNLRYESKVRIRKTKQFYRESI